jgi:hypothetical protein
MRSYVMDNKKYYLANDLMSQYPSFFKGCKTARSVVRLKSKISKEHYVFARLVDDEWIICDGNSKKFDKLFIRKKWFDDNHADNHKNTIEMAPAIICLKDDEKFVDNDGNIVEIEVRGEREYDKCYFRVRDIMNEFDLKNLQGTILDPNSGHTNMIHYKFFYLKNLSQSPNAKRLFLTYAGFSRIINITLAKIVDPHSYNNICRWLSQFVNNSAGNYTIDIKDIDKTNLYGYTYCISSPIVNSVKIGFWTGNIDGLMARYQTYYGKDIQLHYVKTKFPYQLEQKCIKHFYEYNVCGELFKKEYFVDYFNYLQNNIIY